MSMPSEKEMQNAVEKRDPSYDGDFFYGVVTTGIFCKPSCPSRSAKPENMRFFPSFDTAKEAGFRACKRCNPTESSSEIDCLIDIARYIETHSDEQLTLAHLGNVAGLSPSQLQRTFKKVFGISPKKYQDAVRMAHLKQSIKNGTSITDAIFSSGFGSISRVYGEDIRNIGMSLKTYRDGGAGETITYACRSTALLGLMIMAVTKKGICTLQFGEDEDSLIAKLEEEFPNANLIPSTTQDTPELDTWMEAVDQYISSGEPRPDLPLDMRGTAFQIKVWQFLVSIKDGESLSYSELAEKIGIPKAARSVATACGKNRIGVLVPCHRVIRGDGGIGGYYWGIDRKRVLLDTEGMRNTDHQ